MPSAAAIGAPDLVALAVARNQDYMRGMDTAPLPGDSPPAARCETAADRQRRLAWEAEMIAEARAELDAGLFVGAAEVDAWIDSIGTDHELPLPATRRR